MEIFDSREWIKNQTKLQKERINKHTDYVSFQSINETHKDKTNKEIIVSLSLELTKKNQILIENKKFLKKESYRDLLSSIENSQKLIAELYRRDMEKKNINKKKFWLF